LIPNHMQYAPPGEGHKSFPSFFLFALLLILSLGSAFFPAESTGQKSEREGLSRFDRLAEEATLLNRRGKYDEVISLLGPHKADQKNDSALFFNELAVAYRNRNQHDDAIQAYQKALSLDPENPVIMKNLADAFYLHKEYSRSAEMAQKALKSNPRFHQARSTLGMAYYRLERYREALDEFEVVLQVNPQDEQAQNFRAAARKKLQEKK
jgi:cytochrome c-type biogenesis protein CcmH/NrfG